MLDGRHGGEPAQHRSPTLQVPEECGRDHIALGREELRAELQPLLEGAAAVGVSLDLLADVTCPLVSPMAPARCMGQQQTQLSREGDELWERASRGRRRGQPLMPPQEGSGTQRPRPTYSSTGTATSDAAGCRIMHACVRIGWRCCCQPHRTSAQQAPCPTPSAQRTVCSHLRATSVRQQLAPHTDIGIQAQDTPCSRTHTPTAWS